MLLRFLLPQDQIHLTPLFAGGAVRNGHLRRESAAEATIRVPGPRNAFFAKTTCLRQMVSAADV